MRQLKARRVQSLQKQSPVLQTLSRATIRAMTCSQCYPFVVSCSCVNLQRLLDGLLSFTTSRRTRIVNSIPFFFSTLQSWKRRSLSRSLKFFASLSQLALPNNHVANCNCCFTLWCSFCPRVKILNECNKERLSTVPPARMSFSSIKTSIVDSL